MADDFEKSGSGEAFPAGSPFQVGNVLAGKYRIEKTLASGGMGIILVAHHLQLDQRVAIKVLRPAALDNPEVVARFAREARAAVRVRGEHVARVLDVGTLDGGIPYMVMEYLRGTDLSRLLKTKGPLPLTDAVDYLLQACEALAEAHAQGVVHRDMKPANLFLTQRADGTALIKVLDFGISKLTIKLDNAEKTEGLTDTSMMMGSPQYMSPEQLKSSRAVDARADIWALGVTLYKLLSGRNAFIAETTPELCVAILLNPPAPLRQAAPHIPAGVERILLRCLEKDPAARYPNVAAFTRALAPFASPTGRLSVDRVTRMESAPQLHSVPPSASDPSQPTGLDVAEAPPAAPPSAKLSLSTMAASATSTDSLQRAVVPPRRSTGLVLGAFFTAVAALSFGFFVVPRWLRKSVSATAAASASAAPTTPAAETATATPTALAPTTASATASATATGTSTAIPAATATAGRTVARPATRPTGATATATATGTSTATATATATPTPTPTATATPTATTAATTTGEIPGFGGRK